MIKEIIATGVDANAAIESGALLLLSLIHI
mgnify:CR=1 FL=1